MAFLRLTTHQLQKNQLLRFSHRLQKWQLLCPTHHVIQSQGYLQKCQHPKTPDRTMHNIYVNTASKNSNFACSIASACRSWQHAAITLFPADFRPAFAAKHIQSLRYTLVGLT